MTIMNTPEKPITQPNSNATTMPTKRQPVDTQDSSYHAKKMRVEARETQSASTQGAMGDKPVAEGEEPVTGVDEPVTGVDEPVTGVDEPVTGVDEPVTGVDEPVTGVDEPVTGVGAAPFQGTYILTGGSPPAGDLRKKDTTLVDLTNDEHEERSVQTQHRSESENWRRRAASTDSSQSPYANESHVLGSGAHIPPTEQQDPSSVNPREATMMTSEMLSSLGNWIEGRGGRGRPYSQVLPARPSVGPLQDTHGYDRASSPSFYNTYGRYINPPRRPLQLYGLPEAQAHVEAERKKIMETFEKSPSTPFGGLIQQQRGTVPKPDTSASPAPRRPKKQCCSSPDLHKPQGGGLLLCRNCQDFVKEDTDDTGASSSLPSEADLVQCCAEPSPFDVGENGVTHIVCLNCGKAYDAGQIFRAMVRHDAGDENDGPVEESSVVFSNSIPRPFRNSESKRCFHKFMELPGELRERIYTIVLQSDDIIAPHLCNAGRPAFGGKADNCNAIRFHDENQTDHNAIYKSLAITRVSKEVRKESLPIFYGANTFDTVADTPTYFSCLEMLGRLNMIRKVEFVVRFWKSEQYSQKLLRMLLQHFEEQKAFEMKHLEETRSKLSGEDKAETETAAKKAVAKGQFYTDDLNVLKKHPQHVMGGLQATFLVLRMLSTNFQDGEYNCKLVIHVPTSTLFDQYNTLLYFPSVCEGLGIQLKLVSGRDAEMQGEAFRLSWSQKYQKKDFTDSTTTKSWAEVEALTKRVQALYPNIEEVPRPARWTYYRRNCKTGEIEWFSIDTVGGGILPQTQQQ